MFRSRTKAIGWKPRKKEAGPEMQGTRYWRFRIPTSPPPSPCTGSPFYNCLPFPQLRTSTRIHRLFSFGFIGCSGLKTTHRAGEGMVRSLTYGTYGAAKDGRLHTRHFSGLNGMKSNVLHGICHVEFVKLHLSWIDISGENLKYK